MNHVSQIITKHKSKITSIEIEPSVAIISASENGIIHIHALTNDFDDLYLKPDKRYQISQIKIKDDFLPSSIQIIFGTSDEKLGICTKGWFKESTQIVHIGKPKL